jgi:hypothetical protein
MVERVRVARAVIVGASALLAVTACSGGTTRAAHAAGAPSSSTSGAPAATTPTALSPTTVQAPTTAAPTATTEALVPQSSPDLAARALFAAWSKGDRAAALQVATPAAVAALFGQPVASYSDRGCQDPISARALCAFEIGDGLAQVGTVRLLAGGWAVDTVTLE